MRSQPPHASDGARGRCPATAGGGWPVWVRSCTACKRVDLDAFFGCPDIVDGRAWRCCHCAAPSFELVQLRLP